MPMVKVQPWFRVEGQGTLKAIVSMSNTVMEPTLTYGKPHKVGNRIKPNSAGIPYTLLLRIEAMGFPTFRLLLYILLRTLPSPVCVQVCSWPSHNFNPSSLRKEAQRLKYPLIEEYLGFLQGIYKGSIGFRVGFRGLQYPLIEEYILNYSRIPNTI